MITKFLKKVAKKIYNSYVFMGYPLLPITRLIRQPMRWYYHQNPLLRHDSTPSFKSLVLFFLSELLVIDHPSDFTIYQKQIKFRSVNSMMSIHGYYVGEIEYHLVKYVVSQITSDYFIMIDVGAHHGLFTTVIAYELKKQGRSGRVHSFEPNPENFSLLEYNVKQNELGDYVNLHQLAVSDTEGTENFLVYKLDNSGNTLEKTSDFSIPEGASVISQEVQTVTLDNFLNQISSIHLIKLDIQGGELLALKGAKQIIDRFKPILVVEAVKEWPTTNQLYNLLVSYGYQVYGLDSNSQLCSLNSSDVFVSWDWVAIPNLS